MLISWKLFKFRRNRTLFFESVFFKLLRLVVLVSFTSYTSLALTLWLKKSFSRRNHILNCILGSFYEWNDISICKLLSWTNSFSSHSHETIKLGTIAMKNMNRYLEHALKRCIIDSYHLKVKLKNIKDAKISIALRRKQQCWKNLKIQFIFN